MTSSTPAPVGLPIGAFVFAAATMGCALVGYFLVWTPWIGAIAAFAAPLLATLGLVSGLRARRRAKRAGQSARPATVGTVCNLVAGAIAVPIALTCGTLNAIGTVAVTAVSMAPTVAAIEIDRRYPADQFWGDESLFYSIPNPLGMGPGEDEGVVRRAVRTTVVGTGALLVAYLWLVGDDGRGDDATTAQP